MKTEMCWGLKTRGPLTFFVCLRPFACWSELSKTTYLPAPAAAEQETLIAGEWVLVKPEDERSRELG